ncbi:MAG: DUF2242 domain-containing protein [Pseudomonadota bacterium]|nr:DUF2242 domain-containing protein [Pseudomonadota bacterium]
MNVTTARLRPLFAGAATTAMLVGCAAPRSAVDTQEAFDSTSTYSRTYAAIDAQTCEAARRTLLSQGYVISVATAEQVRGRKSFQPMPETHMEVEFNVVCAKDGYAGRRTIAFVNAVQDRYALKKSNNSASLGVGVFGSLSLPFSGSDESLVKVASATITSAPFYDRFFQLVERYLAGDPGQRIEPAAETAEPEPLPIGAAVPAVPAASGARAAP